MTVNSERLLEIERIITHQEQQIQDLSDMVSQQWKELDKLNKHLNRARERLDTLENTPEGSGIIDEKPPHY